jgi:hypothetical protein
MAEERHFVMRWPELDISVECEPLPYNRGIYEWWLDHMPIKAVQSHAAVTGDVFYTLNVRLPETAPVFPRSELKIDWMTEAPVGYGVLSYNERGGLAGGRIGNVAAYYGPSTEYMETCLSFKVIDGDIEKMKQAGRAIWRAIYKTKQIITVELSVKK